MNDMKICVDFVMDVLQTLKNECKKHEYCSEKDCKLYNREYATCLLRSCPCDYELQEIEKRLFEIIQDELKDGENNG